MRLSGHLSFVLLFGSSAWILAGPTQAQVSLTTLGTPSTQNFDTLPTTGSATWTNNSTIPGWYHARTGSGTTIVANNGGSNAGNLYSYGTGTATDRALGSVGSGNAAAGSFFWGVRLQNNTGSTITQLDVSYVGEQWRNSAAAAQTVAFSYLVGSPTVTGSLAEFQSAGVAFPALSFTSPITGGTAAALDGNLAANQVALSISITGLSIPNGTEVMLRWSDPDHTGADHGLSIDTFSVTPQGAAPTPALNIGDVTMLEGNPPGTTTFTFPVSLTSPAGAGGVTFDIATADGSATVANSDYVAQSLTGQTISAGSTGPYNFNVTVNRDIAVEPDETFFVNVTNITGATAGDTQGLGTITNDDVAASADLAITKTDSPDPVTAGTALTYTVTVTNGGPSVATTASWSDILPAGTTFASLASAAGWSCTTPAVGATGTVSCSNPSVAVGANLFTLVVDVDAGLPNATVISNTATANSTTADPTPGNNSATATTTVATSADLSVTKTDSPDPVTAGTALTYTVTVTNAGPSVATTASWSDILPAGTTFASLANAAGWSCTTPAVGATGTVSCSNPSVAVGANLFTLVVDVDAGLPNATVISNTATASSATTDPVPGNNSATATTTVGASADLSVAKTDSPDPVTAGTALTYTVTVTNAGPSVADTANWSDTLPAGTTFVSLATAAGWSCTTPAVGATGTVTCSNSTVAVGASLFTLVVDVDAGLPNATVISNTATVSSATADPAPGNNSATATTTVSASADLSISKVDGVDPVAPDQDLPYTIVVTNAGPSAAAGASWSDTLPASTTFQSLVAAAGWSCSTPAVGATGTVTCSIASLAPGSANFTLTVHVDPGALPGSAITNTATATSTTADPNPGAESSTATTAVSSPAAVTATKTVVGDFQAGRAITYTIVLANAGPSTQADNPGDELTDTLPAELTLVNAFASAGTVSTVGNTVSWNGAIAAGTSVTIILDAIIAAGLPNGTVITNQATYNYDADGNGTNEATGVSDDPDVPGSADSTAFSVLGSALEIPTLDRLSLVLMALLLAATALARRRAGSRR